MQPGELRPGHRLHLRGSVEFHGAGTQRNHGPVQGEIPVGEPTQVAHHGGLAAVHAELRVVQDVADSCQSRREVPAGFHPRGVQAPQNRFDVAVSGRLISGDPDRTVQLTQIDSCVGRAGHNSGRILVLDHHRVEELLLTHTQSGRGR